MNPSATVTLASAHAGNAPSSLLGRLDAVSSSRGFAYGTIFLLQLRTFLYVWHKDLIEGDTAVYFTIASRWFTNHQLPNLIYSPLYLVYYGSLLRLTQDAFAVQIIHRVLIVLAIGALLLAVARTLLPPMIAWFVTAWWVVLPVNYDARFEVHLFAALPVLAAWWVAGRPRANAWTRAGTLGIFAAAALLVRLELLVALGCFACICLIIECRALRKHFSSRRMVATLAPYLTIGVLLAAVFGWFIKQCPASLEQELYILRSKQATTMGQWYAFGYQQRHTDWTKSPWGDFPELMKRDFGSADPSLIQMWRHNSRALTEHVYWHYRLLPAGLQLSLFNEAGGKILPDIQGWYTRDSRSAWILTYVLLSILAIASAISLFRLKALRARLRSRSLAWLAMACVAISAPLILLTSPARPEIFICHSIILMIVLGAAVYMLFQDWPRPSWAGLILPAAFLAAICGLPLHFPLRDAGDTISREYERLKPYESLIQRPDVVLLHKFGVSAMYWGELPGNSRDYSELAPAAWRANESLVDMLDRKGINLFYLDRPERRSLASQRPGAVDRFMSEGSRQGWRILHDIDTPRESWSLFRRETPARTKKAE